MIKLLPPTAVQEKPWRCSRPWRAAGTGICCHAGCAEADARAWRGIPGMQGPLCSGWADPGERPRCWYRPQPHRPAPHTALLPRMSQDSGGLQSLPAGAPSAPLRVWNGRSCLPCRLEASRSRAAGCGACGNLPPSHPGDEWPRGRRASQLCGRACPGSRLALRQGHPAVRRRHRGAAGPGLRLPHQRQHQVLAGGLPPAVPAHPGAVQGLRARQAGPLPGPACGPCL